MRINPTVSESRKGKFSMVTLRTVVSSVAKSLFSAKTSDLASRFMMVDLPTLVYPTSATRTILPRFCRCVAICRSMRLSSSRRSAIRLPMIRLSASICVSPVPRFVPPPPRCLSKWLHIRVRRGSIYCRCAISTWVLA